MRYNQESLRESSRLDRCTKEGRLSHKAPKEKYRDRWFRLKGNLLFVFRYCENGVQPEKEAAGMFVLEEFVVKVEQYAEKLNVFSIDFSGDDRNKHYFSCVSKQACNDWVTAVRQASFCHLKNQMKSLSAHIQNRTGQDPLLDITHRMQQSCHLQPVPSHIKPVRKAPPPPPPPQPPTKQSTWFADLPAPAAPKTQQSTWFGDLQTLQPLQLQEANQLPAPLNPLIVPMRSSAAQSKPSAASKRCSQPATWFTDLKDTLTPTVVSSQQAISSTNSSLDAFGMNPSFHNKNNDVSSPSLQSNVVDVSSRSLQSNVVDMSSQSMPFNWTTFD